MDADDLAAIDADYQTHCVECFMGMPEHCTEGLAPNGQPCVTTPAQRIAWLLDVVQRVVAQRNTADVENAAITARLAGVEQERTAQDGRWRALVGELAGWLLPAERMARQAVEYGWEDGIPVVLPPLLVMRVLDAAQAQAALDGAA